MESFLAEQRQLQNFIESALNAPEKLDAIHPSFITTPRIKSHLELELKKRLQHYARETYGQNNEFESFLENGKQLVELSIGLSLRDEIDATFPLLLLEEFFEYLPVFLMKNLFDWMVSKRHLLLKDMVPTKGKGLYTLRLCNSLLRRISKTSEPQFCGKILVFLSSTFPLTERSAVNLRGHVNLDHPILLDAAVEHSEESAVIDWVEVNKILRDKKAEERNSYFQSIQGLDLKPLVHTLSILVEEQDLPYNFYQAFWLFQDFCKNGLCLASEASTCQVKVPASLEVPEETTFKPLLNVGTPSTLEATQPIVFVFWPLFVQLVDLILTLFRQLRETALSGDSLNFPVDSLKPYEFVSPYYLASKKLLQFQLKDPKFHIRCILEFSIVFAGFSRHFKARNDKSFEEQVEFLEKEFQKTLDLLDLYGVDSASITRLINEECQWDQWKKQGCPAYEQYQTEAEKDIVMTNPIVTVPERTLSPISDLLGDAVVPITKDVALERIRTRFLPRPSAIAYLEPLREQLKPDSGIEREYRLDNQALFISTAMRLILRDPNYNLLDSIVEKETKENDQTMENNKLQRSSVISARRIVFDFLYKKYPELQGTKTCISGNNDEDMMDFFSEALTQK